MTTFHSDKYKIIRGVTSKEVIKFIFNYFLLKRKAVETMRKTNYIGEVIPPDISDFGVFDDALVPDTYSIYSDRVMETLLTWIQPKVEENTGLKLTPTYSYARIYKKGDILPRHSDRGASEIASTTHLGGDPWSIYLEPDIKVDLAPGDTLVYSGIELEHWREKFTGDTCAQVFLFYNSMRKDKFDNRPHLGLPDAFSTTINP